MGSPRLRFQALLGDTYTITQEDIGKSIKVVTTFTDDNGLF